MDLPGGASARKAALLIGAAIVLGGMIVGVMSGVGSLERVQRASPGVDQGQTTPLDDLGLSAAPSAEPAYGFVGNSPQPDSTVPIEPSTSITFTATMTESTTEEYGTSPQSGLNGSSGAGNQTGGNTLGTGSLLEFSSDVTIEVSSPESVASSVAALAYSTGGYVAYQTTYPTSAYVVIRVPAADYQGVLSQVKSMGTLVSLASNSNDVSVQYTDLNATLASLRTEEGSLLKLLNESTTINSTLAIEGQLQQVDQQIDSTETQILQTNTLVQYSTIDVTVNQTQASVPLTMVVEAAPTNGTAPLAVTFDAIVKGGAAPYVVNFNFGDGTSYQGQTLIHTYYQAGDYRVTVTATDQNGTVVQRTTTVDVVAAPSPSGVVTFLGSVGTLFLGVVEGIVEVAVVVLPLVAVAAVVIIPVKRKFWPSKAKAPQ